MGGSRLILSGLLRQGVLFSVSGMWLKVWAIFGGLCGAGCCYQGPSTWGLFGLQSSWDSCPDHFWPPGPEQMVEQSPGASSTYLWGNHSGVPPLTWP